jgi:DNA-binding winged helix-turn-helix (wHTH) protein
MQFGSFEFDARTLELRERGELIPLQQQPARVLALLLERRGELVTREELRSAIWGDDTFVDFNRSLNFCVSQLRGALGDSAAEPRFIETLRGRGYRLTLAEPDASTSVIASDTAEPPGGASRAAWRHWKLLTAAAALIIAPVAWGIASGGASASRVAVLPFASGSDEQPWSTALQAQIVAHLAHTPVHVMGAVPAAGNVWRLDGRVDRSSEQYRVTITLRDQEGAVRWSDVFDGPPGDWIEAQNEMARIITQAVRYNIEGPNAIIGIERRVPRRKIPFS